MKKAGRPNKASRRITVTVSQHHADELQALADEAKVTRSALCSHILERYAIQDRTLMTNDILTERLESTLKEHMAEFTQRFGDLILRESHEVVALRRQVIALTLSRYGKESSRKIKKASWKAAVDSLRPYTNRIEGATVNEEEPESSEVDSR